MHSSVLSLAVDAVLEGDDSDLCITVLFVTTKVQCQNPPKTGTVHMYSLYIYWIVNGLRAHDFRRSAPSRRGASVLLDLMWVIIPSEARRCAFSVNAPLPLRM